MDFKAVTAGPPFMRRLYAWRDERKLQEELKGIEARIQELQKTPKKAARKSSHPRAKHRMIAPRDDCQSHSLKGESSIIECAVRFENSTENNSSVWRPSATSFRVLW
jgi:hypothetical protein